MGLSLDAEISLEGGQRECVKSLNQHRSANEDTSLLNRERTGKAPAFNETAKLDRDWFPRER